MDLLRYHPRCLLLLLRLRLGRRRLLALPELLLLLRGWCLKLRMLRMLHGHSWNLLLMLNRMLLRLELMLGCGESSSLLGVLLLRRVKVLRSRLLLLKSMHGGLLLLDELGVLLVHEGLRVLLLLLGRKGPSLEGLLLLGRCLVRISCLWAGAAWSWLLLGLRWIEKHGWLVRRQGRAAASVDLLLRLGLLLLLCLLG